MMLKSRFVGACLALAPALFVPATSGAKEPSKSPETSVQIALLLDTSNSMDGLIDQAKTQLWQVVNEFVRSRRDGRTPAMQVALYEYGKQSLPSQEGFVRLILPLTDDLDKVSEELFALTTNGGDEYCGQVIRDAVQGLSWSDSREVYKAIFIAGNEPFSQGPVDFRDACRAAIAKGVLVNTIFCGPDSEGMQTGWKDGAVLADGRYLSINQDAKVADIPAPQDQQIVLLNEALNKTYIPYGRMGREGQQRQVAQDSNAAKASVGVLASRAGVKNNFRFYCNDDWDLVDAIKTGKCTLEDLKDEDLPEDLRKLDSAGRKARVEEMTTRRDEINQKVQKLNEARAKFLAEERRKRAEEAGEQTLDAAMIQVIREQAARLKFTFE